MLFQNGEIKEGCFRVLEPGKDDFKVILRVGFCYRLGRVYDKIVWGS